MRKVLVAIRKILAAVALPVVAFVDGAWRVIRSLGPQPSTALEDEADEILDEAPAPKPRDRSALEAARAAATSTEESRVRLAAQALMRREPVTTLEPSVDRDRVLLSWLRGMDPFELATVVSLSPDRLRQHLDGRMGAPLPPVREAEPEAEEIDEMDVEPAGPVRRAA